MFHTETFKAAPDPGFNHKNMILLVKKIVAQIVIGGSH
jgi:hypothetical protein